MDQEQDSNKGELEGSWRGVGGEWEGSWRGVGGELEGSWRGEVEKSKLFCSLIPRLSLLRRREPGNEANIHTTQVCPNVYSGAIYTEIRDGKVCAL